MPETGLITFTHKELVEILVKSQNLTEGIWQLYMNFGIKAANLGSSEADVLPTAMIPVLQIGLKKVDKENNLSVDASKVNPKPKAGSGKKK